MYTKANIYTNQKVFFIKKTINRNNTPINNILSPNYIKNNNNNFFYQTRTTKIRKHYIKEKSSDYPSENVISYNSSNFNKRLSKSTDKKRDQERYNINTKFNIYNRKINTNSKKKVKLKLSKDPSKDLIFMTDKKESNLNNTELIRKKKELEDQREIERKIMEWFYINNINISKRDLFDAFTTLIQSVFRGWRFRSKINIPFHKKNKKIKNDFINLNKLYYKLMRQNLKYSFYKIKKCLYGKNVEKASYKEIKELIKQNNELQKKLGSLINENNNLRKETEICKEYKNKYQETLDQFNKIYKVNDNIIKENQNLKKKLQVLEAQISHANELKKNNYFIITKLKPINYLRNKNINKENKNDRWEILKIEKQNNINISVLDKPKKLEIESINQFDINSTVANIDLTMNKENDINIISHVENNNEMKIKEQELNNKLKNEIIVLKNQINENNINMNKANDELDKQLELNKLKSLFKFKTLFIRKKIHKYFLSFYYKSKANITNQENIMPKINVDSQIPIVTPPVASVPLGPPIQNIVNDASPISPKIAEQIPNNNNTEEGTNKKEVNFIEEKEKEKKEKEEKEEKEKKSRLLKSRNLRRLLSKKVQDKKDNIRKYFYKYEHIVMMFKIRSKLLQMKKKEIEERMKEEKIENEKYKHIQSQRDRQERIASIFNKLDKKISLILKTALEAWNVKAKVMSIKTILIPLKNKTKKKKKKPKSE